MKITDLLKSGHINVLVGTKALLGEGWDSPCINTLIMASFIGSYVLSNQMRGRAIRTDKNNTNKKSNVWHLVCLNPFDYNFSYDYYNLKKRFSTFVGIDANKQLVENGIERLGLERIPHNEIEAKKQNERMLDLSKNRELIKRTWDKCINSSKRVDSLCKITTITRRRLRKDYSFYSTLINLFLSFIVLHSCYGLFKNVIDNGLTKHFSFYIAIILAFIFLILFIYNIYYFFNLLNPEFKLYSIGDATLKALRKSGHITSKKVKLRVYRKWGTSSIYLLNATTYEQNIFSDCISQIFGEINQPRYLLAKPKMIYPSEYYVVPEVFKKNKESVMVFYRQLRRKMGMFDVIFAKNVTGKNQVLKAEKLYYYKFKKVDISTKNVLLKANLKFWKF